MLSSGAGKLALGSCSIRSQHLVLGPCPQPLDHREDDRRDCEKLISALSTAQNLNVLLLHLSTNRPTNMLGYSSWTSLAYQTLRQVSWLKFRLLLRKCLFQCSVFSKQFSLISCFNLPKTLGWNNNFCLILQTICSARWLLLGSNVNQESIIPNRVAKKFSDFNNMKMLCWGFCL